MKISLILPTRKRYDALSRSIESLRLNASQGCYEVLLGVDLDDVDTLCRLASSPIEKTRIVLFQRWGYKNLQQYVNRLCAESTGDWLFLWNDDALMTTFGWDEIICSFNGSFLLLNPDSNHQNHASGNCIFPVIPALWFETLGHFSLSNHNDTWVELVAKHLNIVRNVPINILHDRVDLTGGNDDVTASERETSTSEFFGAEVQSQIKADAEVLKIALLKDPRTAVPEGRK